MMKYPEVLVEIEIPSACHYVLAILNDDDQGRKLNVQTIFNSTAPSMSVFRRMALGAQIGWRFLIFTGVVWLGSIAMWIFFPQLLLDGVGGRGVLALLFPIIIPPILVYGLYALGKSAENNSVD